jgi:hypothetical protein
LASFAGRDVFDAIAQILATYSQVECANSIKDARYAKI